MFFVRPQTLQVHSLISRAALAQHHALALLEGDGTRDLEADRLGFGNVSISIDVFGWHIVFEM